MGYYTGAGVVTGGHHETHLLGTLLYNGGQHVYQTSVAETKVRAGVALTDCTALTSSCSREKATFSRTGAYPWMAATGSSTNYSWSRIGDSNLYSLTINTETLTAS